MRLSAINLGNLEKILSSCISVIYILKVRSSRKEFLNSLIEEALR